MGLLSFIKEAGEKLFSGEAEAAQQPAGADAANAKASEAIAKYLETLKLAPSDLSVKFDGATATVTLSGTAPDQATKEKILVAAGNVRGVGQVDDRMTVAKPDAEARFHTVVRGDTLSAIAQSYYGNPNKYQAIFEANKPMLSDPDKIYPGQVLRIPPLA